MLIALPGSTGWPKKLAPMLFCSKKSELTSGSTWHAAGNLPLYMGGHTLTDIHQSSLQFYAAFEATTQHDIGLHRCGSIKLATSEDEMRAQHAYRKVANRAGIHFEVIAPDEIQRRFPYVSIEGIFSAAWTPDDGHVDPARLTVALADNARQLGASVFRHQRVTRVARNPKGTWTIGTDKHDISAEHVVNAAGLHAREVSKMFGHVLPVVPMERQYLITETLPEIDDLSAELPVLRDASAPLYARQEGRAMLVGLY